MNNKGIQRRIAHFPCDLQRFKGREVSANIAKVRLFFPCLYLTKMLVASMLIIPTASEGNNTKPKIAKATNRHPSSPSLPLSLLVFNLLSIAFHLKSPEDVMYWST